MAPLILHNVPDEELYVGEDGVQRPYAMIFSQDGSIPTTNHRNRRPVPETGAFGKTTRRSRSKTATPARREDPTIQNAHKVFTAYFDQQNNSSPDEAPDALSQKQRRSSGASHLQLLNGVAADDTQSPPGTRSAAQRNIPNVPTEVSLRGFKDVDQQYAAINRYEHIAGRICEDYPRDPPYEIRRYKSDLRDPALTRRRVVVTPEERAKVNRADSGNHWVKITFESQQAADAALYASPQAILGHLVYAELYRGTAPARDEPIPDATTLAQGDEIPAGWRRAGFGGNNTAAELRQNFQNGRLPREVIADDHEMDISPPHSHTSSRTVESGTVGTGTSSTSTITGGVAPNNALITAADATQADPAYCKGIPTARKAILLPAEQALLPQQSFTSRMLGQVPFLKWFSGSMIGSQVPRTNEGEFDWVNASLYWKLICWLDMWFALFAGDIVNKDKED